MDGTGAALPEQIVLLLLLLFLPGLTRDYQRAIVGGDLQVVRLDARYGDLDGKLLRRLIGVQGGPNVTAPDAWLGPEGRKGPAHNAAKESVYFLYIRPRFPTNRQHTRYLLVL